MRSVFIVSAVAAALLAACVGSSSPSSTAPIDAEVSHAFDDAEGTGGVVADVTLPEASAGGAPFSFVADPGGILVVYFGYTSCPDVCPTTLADLRTALEGLGPDAARVDVAMVTVDPERDTDDVITAYLHVFAPEGHALRTTDDAELRTAADAFGVRYSVTKVKDGPPAVEHSAYLFAVDDTGTIQRRWFFGVEPDIIRSDLQSLLASG